uniref:glucuronyl hydrolase n=1 Tax=uncultured Draconibacterium sp. TaxID=1573823 RepID=UPI0032165592
MRRFILLGILFVFVISCNQVSNKKNAQLIKELEAQLTYFTDHTKDSLKVARTFEDGTYNMVSNKDWTCGFPPGTMWYMYELTGSDKWKKIAAENTLKLDGVQYLTHTHDLGFMVFCSYGNAYRLTGEAKYKEVILQASETLAGRFDESIGCIRSWDFGSWQFPVIIDNMMNLEMLIWASEVSGNPKYKEIAVSHADVTMKNHFREDMSSWHVVSYDTTSYGVEIKQTHQGLNDDSAWGRGQAWGLYGYSVMYRETGDVKYLETAEKIADFILPHLPEDKVSYWDYNDPAGAKTLRDVSAAAITASALFEMAGFGGEKKDVYLKTANKIIESLNSDAYRAQYGTNGGFLLMHSVGNMPGGTEVDVPLDYADYYYLEALKRQREILK